MAYRLTGSRPPAWINRAAKLGTMFPCVVPQGWVEPPSAEDEDMVRDRRAVAVPPTEIAFEPVDDPFTSQRPIATPRHQRRAVLGGGGGGRGGGEREQAGVGLNSSEFGASPITPWDMMFTPNTQAIETTAVVGTPVTVRLTESFLSMAVTPEQEDAQEGSSSAAGVSTASFIKRPSWTAFEQEEEKEGEEGDVGDNDGIHPGDKVLDDDDVESFLSKRESLIRGRRAIEKQPRRLSSHTGPHDMYYSSSSVGMATPESFTTPQFRELPPLSTQLPTRTPGVGQGRFNPSLMSREDPDTPIGRNNRDQDNDEPPSLWTNAARRAMLDLKKHVYQGESDEAQGNARGEMSRSSTVVVADSWAEEETPMGTSRILPSSLIRRSEPERDPFLQTPRPERDPYNGESVRDKEVLDEREFLRNVVLDEADQDQGLRNVAPDTAFISEEHDSIAELIYESGDLEEERRRRNEIREVIRANRSFELGLKAAREEKEAETAARAAAEATIAQELMDASAKTAEAEVEVEVEEESEDKILRRKLDAEVERAMSMFDGKRFTEGFFADSVA
ncbi:hypothetical protein KI688_006304 [Linnemannia hyalina]|uniref:Uncharacterized protein n=1 Tax=Linnemannia hyalina TaxID=64524 RepID=A0A9P7Y3F5_9FUNG|nr:hypothetical protein KI688_006304 [Linnemannia hyalina]